MSRILRLTMLAPDIVEAILAGRPSEALVLEQMERPLPASWDEQQQTMSVFIAADGRPLVKSPPAVKAG